MTFREARALCQHSYKNLRAGQKVEVEKAAWTVERTYDVGGFAAYQISKPNGWNAVVYRGTCNWQGWVLNNLPNMLGWERPPQYLTGAQIAASQPAGTILVGHSLGGGIATYASAQHGMPAVTIFPAPVIPSGLPDQGRGADVVNYVCHGEALTEMTAGGRRKELWDNVVQDEVNYRISGGKRHRRLGIDHWVRSKSSSPIGKHDLDEII